MRHGGLAPASPHRLLPTWHCLLPLPTAEGKRDNCHLGRGVLVNRVFRSFILYSSIHVFAYVKTSRLDEVNTLVWRELAGSGRRTAACGRASVIVGHVPTLLGPAAARPGTQPGAERSGCGQGLGVAHHHGGSSTCSPCGAALTEAGARPLQSQAGGSRVAGAGWPGGSRLCGNGLCLGRAPGHLC